MSRLSKKRETPMKYIVDGYNVMHQVEQLQGNELRLQREGLIRLLETAQSAGRKINDITVVFDGQQGVFAPKVSSTIKVIFSQGKTADEKIKEMVESSSFARDIAVVSDDRQIKSYISSLGAKKISVSQFLKKALQPSVCLEHKNHTFKLTEQQATKINQELEKIWLNEGTTY